jgi:hypothetical protein
MRAVEDVWREAFEGEVLGAALFERLATLLPAESHERSRVEVLHRLESSTLAMLRPVLAAKGIAASGEAAARATGEQFADGLASQPWSALVASLQTATASYAALYGELRPLVGPEDLAVVDALVAHEEALRTFAVREAAGDPTSVEPILSLPHVAVTPPP